MMEKYLIKKIVNYSGINETIFVDYTDVLIPKSGGTFNGVVVAPSFSGDGSNLTGIPTGGVQADNTVIVNSLNDISSELSGDTYVLSGNTKYIITNPINLGSNYITMSDGTVIEGVSALISQLIYSGTGAEIRSTDGNNTISRMTLVSYNPSGKVFECVNTGKNKNFIILDTIIANSTEVGSFDGYDSILTNTINHVNVSNGWTFTNVKHLFYLDCVFGYTNSGTLINIPSGTFEDIVISRCYLDVGAGVVGIDLVESATTFNTCVLSQNITNTTSGTTYQNFQPLNSGFNSRANSGTLPIPNSIILPTLISNDVFQVTTPSVGMIIYISDLLTMATWNGSYWEYPDGSKILKTAFNEDWESGSFVTNGWVTVNGGENDWFVGTAAQFDGTYGAYISADGGTSNTYSSVGRALDVSHLYIDITLPNASLEMDLEFNWRCEGEVNYDAMQVFNAPTSVKPVANSEVSTTYLIGLSQYNNQSTWTSESIAIPLSQAGTTRRFIFSWRNDSTVENQPPAAIDNIKITWL